MMIRMGLFIAVMSLLAGVAGAQERSPRQAEHGPPPQAYEDCKGRKAGDRIEHTTPQGKVAAVCEESPRGLVARPERTPGPGSKDRPPQGPPMTGDKPREAAQGYSLEQAVSDHAQLHTMAFNALAFLTGDFGTATFLPPGKVSDFFGFQYMRDIDREGKGHNPMFLDRIAGNVLKVFAPEQRLLLHEAALAQKDLMEEIALKRFPLIHAFYEELDGEVPPGKTGLNRSAVLAHCGEIFLLDARLAYNRAKVFAEVSRTLTGEQKQALSRLKFGDFNSWPNVNRDEVRSLLAPGAPKLVNVGVMTLASEFFSWTAGSVDADTYFCPERHGTYFGGFYLKDLPAMGKEDYDISTSLTGDAGARFLEVLTPAQRSRLTEAMERQRKTLGEIILVRRTIATALRKLLRSETPDEREIMAHGIRYGELDGELSLDYANAFIFISRSLDTAQKERVRELRSLKDREEGNAFLYSDRIPLPKLPDTAFLFGSKRLQDGR